MSAVLAMCGLFARGDLLAAIVEVESGGNALALAVNDAMELMRQPRDLAEAVAIARWLSRHGYSFDAGLGQVNSANFDRLGLDAESVFEPCANLRAAATILEECSERARAAGLAGHRAEAASLSCYNTGHLTRGIANGYADAVRARLAPGLPRAEPSSSRRRAAVSFAELARPAEAFGASVAEAFATAVAPDRRDVIEHTPVRSPPNTERSTR